MRFASARCILWLLQQRRPVTSPLGVVRRKSTSGDRFHALAIDGGESVAAKVYHTRGKSAILQDPSANRRWVRIDQEPRAPGLPRDRPSSSKLRAAWNPNLARAVTQRRGEGIIPRINVHADSHGPSMITRARERASAVTSTKYWTTSPPRSQTIHTSA